MKTRLSQAILSDPKETAKNSPPKRAILYATDVLSQPAHEVMIQNDPLLHHQCTRALPIAQEEDIVVLHGSLDEEYHKWLRGLNMSTDRVISYDRPIGEQPLHEIIEANPTPVLESLESDVAYTYLPFYLSNRVRDCARALGLTPFGCAEEITLKYFDKLSFKEECQRLGIKTIGGQHHSIDASRPLNEQEIGEVILRLLKNYGKVIVRGTDGSAGRSLYTIEKPDVAELYEKLVQNRDKTILIEPFLNVISSPNDQWIIDGSGAVTHFGLSAQLFQGLKHAGNFYGQYYSERVFHYISQMSRKIVDAMSKGGYRGIVGIDYIICEEGIFPIENNARMNGSSFALELFEILRQRNTDIACWKFYKAKCTHKSFSDLKDKTSKFLFDGEKTNSFFPFVTNLIPERGEFIALLLAEDTYHIDYLQDALTYAGICRS